eukprot:51497-Chlamydomonas_euryale.AAC.5
MAKGLSIKDAIKIFEAKKSAETGNPVIAAEAVKVGARVGTRVCATAGAPRMLSRQHMRCSTCRWS